MADGEATPESNFRNKRGVILGPIIGGITGSVASLFVDAPTGAVIGGCMLVGLIVGALLDYLKRTAVRRD